MIYFFAALSVLLMSVLPWWLVLVVCVLCGYFSLRTVAALKAGAVVAGVSWFVATVANNFRSHQVPGLRLSSMLGGIDAWWIILILTGLVAFLGALSAWSGFLLKQDILRMKSARK